MGESNDVNGRENTSCDGGRHSEVEHEMQKLIKKNDKRDPIIVLLFIK
jgi:hypothetical protein